MKRRNRGKRGKRSGTRNYLYYAVYAALIILIVVSAYHLGAFLLRARDTKITNDRLAALHTEADRTAAEEHTETEDDPGASAAPEQTFDLSEFEFCTPEPHRLLRKYQTVTNRFLPGVNKMLDINRDFAGWLDIPGVLSLPVVYRDNTTYLDRDFYGKKSAAGTVFIDELHPLTAETQLLFLHGHNTYDGSMFAMITHYRTTDFLREHPEITFKTLWSEDHYRVIGSLYVTEEELIDICGLGTPNFDSEEQFDEFIANLRAHAIHFTTEPVYPEDALLALSTCYKDGRLVVFFKRID